MENSVNSFKKYDHPYVTVDIIVLTIRDEQLQVALVKRGVEPFKDVWALPGGFVHSDESLDEAAKRELKEEIGVSDVYLEQLYTFGDPKRDPRDRIITVAYYALVSADELELVAKTDVIEAEWHPVTKLPKLAFDHKEIIHNALDRVRAKLEYSTVAMGLLPKKFTLSDLQQVYEVILGQPLDKRNFRKKLQSLDILEPTNEQFLGGAHRPASLYKFKEKRLVFFN